MRAWEALAIGATVCACLGAAGCGGDPLGRQPVAGSVTLNGAPLEKGNVSFEPVDKGIGSGATVSGGKFSMARKDGLPAGKYRVTINAPSKGSGVDPDALPGDAPAPPQDLIPPEWNTKSENYVEVTDKGKNEFTFNVEAKKK